MQSPLCCNKQPSHGVKGSQPEFCTEHKSEDMVDMRMGCSQDGCETCPSFGVKGGKKREFCKSTNEKIWFISPRIDATGHNGCST